MTVGFCATILLGLEYGAHAAFADLLEQFVGADRGAGTLGDGAVVGSHVQGHGKGAFQRTRGIFECCLEGVNALSQLGIAMALTVEEARARLPPEERLTTPPGAALDRGM